MTTVAEPQLSRVAQELAQLHQQPPPPAAVFTPSAPTAAAAESATSPTAHTSTQLKQPNQQPLQESAQATLKPAAAISPTSAEEQDDDYSVDFLGLSGP